jgi:peptide-methionine (R)-S-oxide reductase
MTTRAKVTKTDEQWRAELSPAEYQVLRQAGTERAFTGEYTDTTEVGVYRCRACGAELFRSDAKFASHCGWPSFYQPAEGDNVVLVESHLGHVFAGEGYPTPTDQRYCINSVSLTLEPAQQ